VDFLLNVLGEDAHCSVGIRSIYQDEIGRVKLRRSWSWNDGERTTSRLDGTSACELTRDYWSADRVALISGATRALARMANYSGVRLALIIGDDLGQDCLATDPGESIIANARVIAYLVGGKII